MLIFGEMKLCYLTAWEPLKASWSECLIYSSSSRKRIHNQELCIISYTKADHIYNAFQNEVKMMRKNRPLWILIFGKWQLSHLKRDTFSVSGAIRWSSLYISPRLLYYGGRDTNLEPSVLPVSSLSSPIIYTNLPTIPRERDPFGEIALSLFVSFGQRVSTKLWGIKLKIIHIIKVAFGLVMAAFFLRF